VTAKDRHFSYL